MTALGGLAYALEVVRLDAPATGRDRLIAWLTFARLRRSSAGCCSLKKDRFPGMNALKWAAPRRSRSALGVMLVLDPANIPLYWLLAGVAAVLGVLLTISIGGADMPVAIALLNSYSGLAGARDRLRHRQLGADHRRLAGRRLGHHPHPDHVQGDEPLDDQRAVRRRWARPPTRPTPTRSTRTVKATSAEEIAMMLDGAQRVVIVPGYGMAVAQAQHTVRELADLLEEKGTKVEYAIHPVAGRMPGHMNVLLAEANIQYEKLREMDDINGEMDQVDVAIVIGANDVVNPVAETDPKSPIAGMPIIQAHKAKTVIVIKRSLSPGFAGIPNPLFAADNALMFFADGKKAIQDIITAVKEAS